MGGRGDRLRRARARSERAPTAVEAFVAAQRGLEDERALELERSIAAGSVGLADHVLATRDFLITGPDAFVLCFPSRSSGDVLQLVNVKLRQHRDRGVEARGAR